MMEYSTGLTSTSYWYLESKKTSKYMLDGLNREKILELAIKENIYQVESKSQTKKIVNRTYRRLNSLPEIILKDVTNSDMATSKILVLISIMKTDRLFFEFMYEVFRNNIILGDYSLKNRDINIFFQDKKSKSETIDNWAESTIKRLKSDYIRMITDAGLLKVDSNKREIVIPFLDYKVKQHLLDNDMASYVYAVTGEK